MSNNPLFRRKPIEAFIKDMNEGGLKRVLGRWGLTAIGVGAIIGTGIFVLTGLGARDHAGPALALSFVVAGLACLFAALCYAEFASFLPVEGSAYAYSYATMGELFAWVIGWDLILEYAMGSSAVAVGWSNYLLKVLGYMHVHLPLWISADYWTAEVMLKKAEAISFLNATLAKTSVVEEIKKITISNELLKDMLKNYTSLEQIQISAKGDTLELMQQKYSSIDFPTIFGKPFAMNLPAFMIIWAVTGLLVKGIKEAASANNVMVVIKIAVILFVIIAGAGYINIENWTPFIPERSMNIYSNGDMKEAFGWTGILSGAGYIFFAYVGFDVVSTSAGEAKNPQKDVPFGIMVALVFCTILYILVSLVLTGMVNYKDIDIHAPIAAAFGKVGLDWAAVLISCAAIAGLTSVLIAMLIGQSRVFYAMAKDGLLPTNVFAKLHPKFQTPYKSSLWIAVFVSLVSAFTPIDKIAEMTNIGTLLAFVMVCAAVWIMRKRNPDLHRPFKTPYIDVVAPLGILLNFGIMCSLDLGNWVRLVVWLAMGMVIYFLYSRHHSKLNSK